MRILYVGMEHRAYASRGHEVLVAETIAKSGHDVGLLTDQKPHWPDNKLPEHLTYLGSKPLNDPAEQEKIVNSLESDYDVAFASSASGAPILAAWKKATGKKIMASVLDFPAWRIDWGHQGPWLKSWTPWYKSLMACDRIVANMQRTKESLLAYAGRFGERMEDVPPIDVLYYGIDTDGADQALAAPIPTEPRGGCVSAARLVPHKGFDLAIQALALLPVDERPHFGIIGEGEDQFRLAQLVQWAGLQLNKDVSFYGPVSDAVKWQLIGASKFGAGLSINPDVPSQFPLESVYMGKPCITADLPINLDRYGNVPGGLAYVNPWDTRAVAGAMNRWTGESEEDAWPNGPGSTVVDSTAVGRARDWIREHRSFRSHARSIIQALEKLT